MHRSLFFILFIFVLKGSLDAQFTAPDDEINAQESTTTDQDTINERSSFFDIFTGKPGKAAFYSLILPGGGQYFNRRYWKIPLVYAIEGGAIYWLLWNRSEESYWQTGYLGLLNGEISDYGGVNTASRAKTFRDFYRKNKEYAYIVVLLAHLLNVFDAFIDRHLIDFDIDDDLSFHASPATQQWSLPTYGTITIRIPISSKTKVKEWYNPLTGQ